MALVDEIVRAMAESKATDDEGQFDSLGDLIGFSGENKTRTVVCAALVVALRKVAEFLEDEANDMPIIRNDYDAGCQQGLQMAVSRIEAMLP